MNKLFQLLTKKFVMARLIDLMNTIKKDTNNAKLPRNLCILRKKVKTYIVPLVDLDINIYCISQVILDFGLQENIMTRTMW